MKYCTMHKFLLENNYIAFMHLQITASKIAPPIIMQVCNKSVQRTVESPPASVQVKKRRAISSSKA